MKNTILSLSLLLFGITNLNAQQDNSIVWQNTIGGTSNDYIYTVNHTSDGGYVLGGISRSDISGDKTENSQGGDDYWIIKFDEDREIEWQNTIGGNQRESLRSITQTIDGGYIVGGYSASGISGDKTEESNGALDYWVIKLDEVGEIEWQNTIGGSGDDLLFDITPTVNGGYILVGYSDSDISGDKTEDSMGETDFWIVKLNEIGEIEWQNTIGGNQEEFIFSIDQTTDGGYILGGSSNSDISGDKTENAIGGDDYWIVKLDNFGNILWDKTIGGTFSDVAFTIFETIDGGYFVGGDSYSNATGDKTENSNGLRDIWVLKLDSLGSIQWQNTIGGNREDSSLSAIQLSNGNYVINSSSESNISGDKTENSFSNSYDYWILNLDENGSINWDNTIGGDEDDFGTNVLQNYNGNFSLFGWSVSNATGDKNEDAIGARDIWILEVSGDPSLGVNDNELANKLSVFPNPTNGKLTVSGIDISTVKITVTNILGDTIKFYEGINTQIDLSDFSSGVYLVTVEVNGIKATKKIVKL